MKVIFYKTVVFTVLISLMSCMNKTEEQKEIIKEVEVKTDTISAETPKEEVQKTVEGVVTNINQGKDGYTATLETSTKEEYFVTISYSNLTNHEQYKSVKVGDNLKVTGDFWKMEDKNQITVRVIE